MAFCRNRVVAAATLMFLVALGTSRGVRGQGGCLSDRYVIPNDESCRNPALYNEEFSIAAPNIGDLGPAPFAFFPETPYYISARPPQEAKYVVTPAGEGATGDAYIETDTAVYITNAETGRALGWMSVGDVSTTSLSVLIETADQPATFRFVRAENVSLPCRTWPLLVVCRAYYLLSTPHPDTAPSASGWLWQFSAWHRGNLIVSAPSGSLGEIPLTLQRVASSTTTTTTTTTTSTHSPVPRRAKFPLAASS